MSKLFSLQLPDELLDEALIAAAEAHVSVDALLARFVEEGISRRRRLSAIQARAASANIVAALDILDRVPDVAADPNDRVL